MNPCADQGFKSIKCGGRERWMKKWGKENVVAAKIEEEADEKKEKAGEHKRNKNHEL